jgi:putative hemolysin
MTSTLAPPCYRIKTTRSASDIRAAQRLRYAVFNVELGEGLSSSNDSE